MLQKFLKNIKKKLKTAVLHISMNFNVVIFSHTVYHTCHVYQLILSLTEVVLSRYRHMTKHPIIREIYYVINWVFLDIWNWQSCPQAHYIIRGSLGMLTEGMQGWREALHPTLASPSTCLPQDTASTGLSELVREGLRGLLQKFKHRYMTPLIQQ